MGKPPSSAWQILFQYQNLHDPLRFLSVRYKALSLAIMCQLAKTWVLLGVVVYAFNPGTGRSLWVPRQSGLHSEWDPISKDFILFLWSTVALLFSKVSHFHSDPCFQGQMDLEHLTKFCQKTFLGDEGPAQCSGRHFNSKNLAYHMITASVKHISVTDGRKLLWTGLKGKLSWLSLWSTAGSSLAQDHDTDEEPWKLITRQDQLVWAQFLLILASKLT